MKTFSVSVGSCRQQYQQSTDEFDDTVGIAEITRQACTYTVQINVPFVKISLELQYFIFPLQSHVETYA